MYGTLNAIGLRPPEDMYQNVGVYLDAQDGAGWQLYTNVTVTSYGFAQDPFKVTVRTNESCR